MQYIYDVLSTRKLRKFTMVSQQNLKDHDEMLMRIQNNGVKMDLVQAILESQFNGKVTIDTLLIFANLMAKKHGLFLDRLARRNKTALICWYTENWNTIQPFIGEINPASKSKNSIKNDKIESKDYNPNIDPSDIFQLLNYHD
ncbi:hypothetical protein TVAG_285360 [Trichomonas vaginalis G3]|uniref:Uncharacterized protein n=1 Tax=Trichomonas vaginalis (strain ATCC PRA-98 / G3) TaxID=412133 RepID=A2GRM6_TRIV3|nr:hypothetical protein TVAGG3_0686050 [Trichomonas vaginalis G3]EAX80190.1 hypothetical protein TVAG_285360 [Trichomonas vaginalis G3]KAI5508236.1 hypothetical protein TVAGG3_0686050 [Trichomonas vaginalis G3]|eukprot:XP_001293120.1 hypothetical protein [Trichomonas vaginalis G3]